MRLSTAQRAAKAEARKKPHRINSRTVIMLSPGKALAEVSTEFMKEVGNG